MAGETLVILPVTQMDKSLDESRCYIPPKSRLPSWPEQIYESFNHHFTTKIQHNVARHLSKGFLYKGWKTFLLSVK